jgi:hypothetical protein
MERKWEWKGSGKWECGIGKRKKVGRWEGGK